MREGEVETEVEGRNEVCCLIPWYRKQTFKRRTLHEILMHQSQSYFKDCSSGSLHREIWHSSSSGDDDLCYTSIMFSLASTVCVCDSFSVCHTWSTKRFYLWQWILHITEQSSTVLFVVFSRLTFFSVQTHCPVYEICSCTNRSSVIANHQNHFCS